MATRTYFRCPVVGCEWDYIWAYVPPKPDPDIGLRIGAHIAAVHPGMLMSKCEEERYEWLISRLQT